MLIFRDDQLTIPIANEQGFVDWYIECFMPENLTKYHRMFDEETRRKRVKHGRDIAIRYSLNDAISQVQFIALMWRFGAHFYRYPGFWAVTQQTDNAGPERIDQYYLLSDNEFAAVMVGEEYSDWFAEPNNNIGQTQEKKE
ncbi:MAG: hypothetical protein ACKE51_08825 [Methylococcaceae bacterium]